MAHPPQQQTLAGRADIPADPGWIVVDPVGACRVCTHSVEVNGQRMCGLVDIDADPPPRTLSAARERGGVCGPDAKHLHFPGLYD